MGGLRVALCGLLLPVAWGQTDPGIRIGAPAAGQALNGLGRDDNDAFFVGMNAFTELSSVTGSIAGTKAGLGPRFNLDSCGGCHRFPAAGGSSPRLNPQVRAASTAQVAPLIALGVLRENGPVRAVRFRSDGAVHALFTITGRSDAPSGCTMPQPDFALHAAAGDLAFRIPTPVFGAGLIEAIPDAAIESLESAVKPYGIAGRANRDESDGTIARFGWKAQNRSLLFTAAEAFNVEQGLTGDLFPSEHSEAGGDAPASCGGPGSGVDRADSAATATFMRLLAAPSSAPNGYTSRDRGIISAVSVTNGRALFEAIGCAVCHTPSLDTGPHPNAALSHRSARLYSDLLVHRMGELGDGVTQGRAGPDEMRTAPLWGVGQRFFLLHDGRTSNLLEAIEAHADGGRDSASEAVEVVLNFNRLTAAQKQDLLNFVRSL